MRRAVPIAVAVLVVLAGAGHAASDRDAWQLSARLVPGEVTRKPGGVRDGAGGRFEGSFWPVGADWERASYSLSTRRLSGPAVSAHIHTGRSARNGPVLVTLCSGGRCNLSGTGSRGYPAGLVETMRVLGAYVDVHTAKNPRGELRGQIVVRER